MPFDQWTCYVESPPKSLLVKLFNEEIILAGEQVCRTMERVKALSR